MNASSPLRESAKIPGTPDQVVRVVGAGATGYVYEVTHAELGKRFMLKTLEQSSTRGEALVQSLRKEWRALAQLEHPNIVRVSDAGVSTDGMPFFVMERLVGETLAKTILRERELPVPEALRVTGGLLEALAAAHEIGIIHRDVKPGNVFLTTKGEVKLLDFGIARELDRDLDKDFRAQPVPHGFGTPRYVSPEQAVGEPLDAKTDLYSAGLMLFEMLTGRSPFEGAEGAQWLHCHVNKIPRACSELTRQHVPKELDVLVASLLEKDPRRRPDARAAARRVSELMESATPAPDTNADTLAFPEPVMDIVAKMRDGDAARAEGDAVFDVPAKRDTAPRLASAVIVEPAAIVDADATLAGTPEAIAAMRGFRAFEPVDDTVSDPAAAADTSEGMPVEPQSFPARSLVVVALLVSGVGFGAFQWGARSERMAQEERREGEQKVSVVPSTSAPAPVAPAASVSGESPVPFPVPSAVAGEAVRPVASAGRAPAPPRKSPRSSPKTNAQGIDLRWVSVAKGGTWVDKPVRIQRSDGTWVDGPASGLGDEEPAAKPTGTAKPKGTAKPNVTAKKKAK